IYIGVNDTWHYFTKGEEVTAADFEHGYRFMLDQLSATRPAAPVLMIVPFVTDVDEEKAGYHADLDQKVAVIRDLAREFGHTLVDLEKVLETAWSVGHSPAGIAEDGVHPTIAGHRLIADAGSKPSAASTRLAAAEPTGPQPRPGQRDQRSGALTSTERKPRRKVRASTRSTGPGRTGLRRCTCPLRASAPTTAYTWLAGRGRWAVGTRGLKGWVEAHTARPCPIQVRICAASGSRTSVRTGEPSSNCSP